MIKEERETKQKKTIRNYLEHTTSHPSAETIYEDVQEELPDISKATVYRILRNLHDKGEIQKIPTKVAKWDKIPNPHPHFYCIKCQTIYDVEEDIQLPEKKNLSIGEVEKFRLVFSGVCKHCKS